MKFISILCFILIIHSNEASTNFDNKNPNIKFIFIPPSQSDAVDYFEKIIDMKAMQRAADTLGDIFKVVPPVPPERSGLLKDLQMGVHCDPFDDGDSPMKTWLNSSIKNETSNQKNESFYDISKSMKGEVVILLHTYTGKDVWKCSKSTLAFSQLCIMEVSLRFLLIENNHFSRLFFFESFFFSQGKSEHVYRGSGEIFSCPTPPPMSRVSREKNLRTYVMGTDSTGQ
jgi:hypothetical protein